MAWIKIIRQKNFQKNLAHTLIFKLTQKGVTRTHLQFGKQAVRPLISAHLEIQQYAGLRTSIKMITVDFFFFQIFRRHFFLTMLYSTPTLKINLLPQKIMKLYVNISFETIRLFKEDGVTNQPIKLI